MAHINAQNQVSENIRPLLDEIADRLWSEPSHAAIMVGAGFSKNANRDFPDWNALGDLFFEKINGRKPGTIEDRYLNVLKLANEVEAAFGRPALNKMLRDEIPDNNSEPSDLHKQLLKLPWTDIFTTNYDTLLEKARKTITSQRFDIVINKEDLVYSEQPRIIKLHGSFPSERPFIITEEDYRTYPQKFAPFVNTVQQSLLENTLCLVGFSGDDPNFLRWIGWIRDNFGNDSSSKIYLVGILKMSEAQKLLLLKRNIVLVDLSQCSDVDEYDHGKALELFFCYLKEYKQNKKSFEWPSSSKPFPSHNSDIKKEISDIVEKWKSIRQNYPGWIIAPEDSREKLWFKTQYWLDLTKFDKLESDLDIKFIYELNWRLEKTLFPITNELAAFYEATIEKYQKIQPNDYQEEIICLKLALIRWCREEGQPDKWNKYFEDISKLHKDLTSEQLSFFYYEQCLFAVFNLDIPQLKKKLREWPSNFSLPLWEAKRAGIMFEIGMVDDSENILEHALSKIREKLNLKPIKDDYSLVSIEALIMVLLRYIKDVRYNSNFQNPATQGEIKKIRELFIHEYRTANKNNFINNKIIEKNEEDEWLEFYDSRKNVTKSDWNKRLNRVRDKVHTTLIEEYSERWNILKQYKCDPIGENRLFACQLKNPPILRKEKTKIHQFDIEDFDTTHYQFSSYDLEAVKAYNFLRLNELAGLPFRTLNMTFNANTAAEAIKRIAHSSPYWSLVSFIRLGNTKYIDSVFDRKALLRLKNEDINTYVDFLLTTLKNTETNLNQKNSFNKQSFSELLAQVLPEILSRLCCKVSKGKRLEILDFIQRVYSSSIKSNYRSMGSLIKRFIKSITIDEAFELIDRFLSFPFPENANFITERQFSNPLLLLSSFTVAKTNKPIKLSEEKLFRAFELAGSAEKKKREWGTTSLICLYNLNLLSKEQSKQLGEILWNRRDINGFPKDTIYYKFSFIFLPHPNDVKPVELLEKYIVKSSFPIKKDKKEKGTSITGGHIPLCNEIIGSANKLNWEQPETLKLLRKLISWWNSDKEYLKKDKQPSFLSDINEEFTNRFRNLVNILVEVIFPNLSVDSIPDKYLDKIKILMRELDEFGLCTIEAKVASSNLLETDKKELVHELSQGMKSLDYDEVVYALKGIKWMSENVFKDDDDMYQQMLQLISQKIQWRHEPGLVSTLNVAGMIIRNDSIINKDEFISACLLGLEDLYTETTLSVDIDDDRFSELLDIRVGCSRFASILCNWFKSDNIKIPSVIEAWREVTLSNEEFAEVRVAWKNEVKF